ncbi:hypothetical protein M9H77_26615 [Catharanthus roseus]|uniref:Uncharacterized protein n=1 Tax=Catharanthus roseus TaxID=4058 RepID=A0ACC0AA52_CATRO|nr:hypothetical protein M9H77_26615 [Catharanthus roseus]
MSYMYGYTQTVTPYLGYNFCYDLVFGSVRRLHCTWLVSRTRVFSDGVDDLDSGEWIHLKRGEDFGKCGPIGLRGHRIMLCGGVGPPSGESRGARHRDLKDTSMHNDQKDDDTDDSIYSEEEVIYEKLQDKYSLL